MHTLPPTDVHPRRDDTAAGPSIVALGNEPAAAVEHCLPHEQWDFFEGTNDAEDAENDAIRGGSTTNSMSQGKPAASEGGDVLVADAPIKSPTKGKPPLTAGPSSRFDCFTTSRN